MDLDNKRSEISDEHLIVSAAGHGIDENLMIRMRIFIFIKNKICVCPDCPEWLAKSKKYWLEYSWNWQARLLNTQGIGRG